MPELPEVETIVRGLRPHVEGRRVEAVEFCAARAAQGQPREMEQRLAGRRIVRLTRRGKHLLFELDTGWMDVHLRMTGKLLLQGARPAYVRARLVLDTGAVIEFEDVRQFGYMVWRERPPLLGPDALEISAEDFCSMLGARRAAVKPLLLQQEVLAGLGNIYVDEALFRAGIHPRAIAARLSKARRARLHCAVREVLREALAMGGSSVSDYVDAEGRPGGFQRQHRVYGRAGEPCPACGAAVRRIVIGQRGTHYCPRCQRP